jgi:type IV secretion system protein TrbL
MILAAVAANANLVDQLIKQFENSAQSWEGAILSEARWLFFTLTMISFVVAVGIPMVLRLDIVSTVGFLAQWAIFTGVSLWGMENGPEFTHGITHSFYQLAGQASGLGADLKPTVFLDLSMKLYGKILAQEHGLDIGAAVGAELSGLAVLFTACFTTYTLVEVLCASWIFASVAPMFLAFGALVFTRDVFINFWRSALALGAKLMALVLIAGLGITFLKGVVAAMGDTPNGQLLGLYLACSIMLAFLARGIPNMLAGVFGVSGGSALGNWGISNGLAMGSLVGQAVIRALKTAGNATDAGLSSVEKAANHAENLRARGIRPTRNGGSRP